MTPPDTDVGPPDSVLVKRRRISIDKAAWARDCLKIMQEYGEVQGRTIYAKRDAARWRARYLIDKIVALELAQRWQLMEHVERKDGGYVWIVEYTGGSK